MNSTRPGQLEPALFALFMAVLVWAPLPFASNRPWASGLLAALLMALLCAWLVLFALGRLDIDQEIWRRGRLPLALLLLVQFWVALQLLPLPADWVAWLSPRSHEWRPGQLWMSLSLDPAYGAHYLLRGLALSAGFFLALALVSSAGRLRMVLQVLVFSGMLQALYASFMVLSGLELGFFVEKYTGRGVATGTFINRNHLAGYLVMSLSAGIGLLLAGMVNQRGSASWRDALRRWLGLLFDSRFRLRAYLAIMVIALVLTRSRMGNIAFFLAMALAGTIALYAGRRFSSRLVALLGSLFLVDMLLLGRWFGFDRLLTRLVEVAPGEELRVWSNANTLEYVAQFFLTGSGGGSFYGIYPNFQAEENGIFHVHAHNDYLEFAAELGLPATALLLAVPLLALHSAYRVQRDRRTSVYRGVAFAVTMTAAWAALHSAVDFNLQIPANALTFLVIMALAFVCRGLPGEKASDRKPR